MVSAILLPLSTAPTSMLAALDLSLFLTAFTLTVATTGIVAVEVVAFAIGVRDGLLGAVGASGFLDDLSVDWDWFSEAPPGNVDATGDCNREEDDAESCGGDTMMPLSSLAVAMVRFVVGVSKLLMELDSMLSLSPLFDAGLLLSLPPTPTAPLNRLYRPLRPFCIMSPAIPWPSLVEEVGGGANSLKVVKVSDSLAVLCILSRAFESCSLSIEPVREASDPRLERLRGKREEAAMEARGESLVDDILLAKNAAM